MVEAAASCSAPQRKAPKIEKKEVTPEQKALKEAIAARTSSLATLKRVFEKHRKDLNEHMGYVSVIKTKGYPDGLTDHMLAQMSPLQKQIDESATFYSGEIIKVAPATVEAANACQRKVDEYVKSLEEAISVCRDGVFKDAKKLRKD